MKTRVPVTISLVVMLGSAFLALRQLAGFDTDFTARRAIFYVVWSLVMIGALTLLLIRLGPKMREMDPPAHLNPKRR
jgi:hypothetical protein